MKAIYPGSFDPVTYGHLDIIARAAKQVDHLVVAVLYNPEKKGLFTLKEKVELLEEVTRDLDNVEIDAFSGLLSDYAVEKGCSTMVRGLRATSDLEYEMQMALTNRKLNSNIDTFFMVSASEYSYLSSSTVRQVAMFGGKVSCFVPRVVENALKEKFKEAYDGRRA